ncbi:kinase-like protein [Clavulina sp. PMI_390]|nr:kinase-like protein [Clavulina sp. PMI_390]
MSRKGGTVLATRKMNNNLENTSDVVRREILTHYLLKHEHLLPLLGVFRHEESFMVVTPFVSNRYSKHSFAHPNASSLHFMKNAALSGRENLPIVLVKILLGAVKGVAYMHGRDPEVIHGDIHPGNILVNENEDAIVCDFGLTRIRHEVTRTNTGIREGGRLRYLAPELTSVPTDKFRTTTASDIFSLGMTFFSLMTLEIPFTGHWEYDAVARINRGERPCRPQTETYVSITPTVEARLWTLVEGMWAQHLGERPTADDVSVSLRGEFNVLAL